MPINFGLFTDDIISYFEAFAARDGQKNGFGDVSRQITNLYVNNILQGMDAQYGNVVTTYNKGALESALVNAFNLGYTGNTNRHFSQIISIGLIRFWTGSQLALVKPPPSAISVVSNIVTIPGTPQQINVRNTTNIREFAENLVRAFRLHLLSLQGITTGLVPAPPGAPAPIPFPWVGYK